jgi:hypothetical protein
MRAPPANRPMRQGGPNSALKVCPITGLRDFLPVAPEGFH